MPSRTPVALDEPTLLLVDAMKGLLKKREGTDYSRPQVIGRATAAFILERAPAVAKKLGIESEEDGEGR